MDKKEYLGKYLYFKNKTKQMELELNEYKRLANSIPGCNFDKVIVDGTRSKEAPGIKWIDKALDLEKEIKRINDNLLKLRSLIISDISEIKDSNLVRVLIFKYIDGFSWDTISNKMYCANSTARRWHEKGLNELKMNNLNAVEKLNIDGHI